MKNLEDLVDEPEEFFRELQRRYVFKNPDISNVAKEVADEHAREAKEDAELRDRLILLGKKKASDQGKS